MSSNTENGSDSTDPYDPGALRKLVPGTLGSEGTRALVCAIRNPDATTGQVAEKCGLGSTYTVENALRSAVQDADREAAQPHQVQERRGGEVRDADTYAELTDKQQAVVDMYAEAPEWCDEHTYSDIAQVIQERDGVVVNETYVGQVQRKYREILHRQRALAASDDEADVALEDALSEMTMREVLEAAGFDLPEGNLDSMPVPDTEQEQATLGDAREADAEFEKASEVADSEGSEGSEHTPLSEAWREAHSGVPGADQAQRLPDSADDEDVGGSPYWAYVNGIVQYGVFVSLTNPPTPQDDVSGLVKDERLHGSPSHYERGQPLVVEFRQQNPQGLEFCDWRLKHPDEASDVQADEQEDEAEAEGSEQEDAPDDSETTPEVAQSALPEDLEQRLAGLERAVGTLRENAVMASEVQEMAERVEATLDAMREEQAAHEDEVWDTLENSVGREVKEQAEDASERVQKLQQVVNSLAEQVEQATSTQGRLGRALQDVQRLQADDARVQAYEYSQQDGTVTLHLEATVPEAEQVDLLQASLPSGQEDDD